MDELLQGEGKAVYGDRAYASAEIKERYEQKGVVWRVPRKAKIGRELSMRDAEWNKRMSKVRARGEQTFSAVKNLWGVSKGTLQSNCQKRCPDPFSPYEVEPIGGPTSHRLYPRVT